MRAARIPARIICPGCRKVVTAVPVEGGYRMRAHNRRLDSIDEPGQTCTATPFVPVERVEYEPADGAW